LRIFHIATAAAFVAISASAIAAPTLTAAECNAYPFVQASQPLTRAQVGSELKDLAKVGYNSGEAYASPHIEIRDAQAKLQVLYKEDCAAGVASSAGTGKDANW
jgi:hypothetical protein